jgi:hypothetical protein
LVEGFQFSNDLVVDLFAFGNKFLAGDFSQLELHFDLGPTLFAGVENLGDFFSLLQFVEQVVEMWGFEVEFMVLGFEVVDVGRVAAGKWAGVGFFRGFEVGVGDEVEGEDVLGEFLLGFLHFEFVDEGQKGPDLF